MKRIIISEKQYKKLYESLVIGKNVISESNILENPENEGFGMNRGVFSFKPNTDNLANTEIFNADKTFKVTKKLLPKSNVMSYNLYDLGKTMKVNKALKHHKDLKGNDVIWNQGEDKYSNSINYFIDRSALYIRSLIGNSPVDYFTCPQSSSGFNKLMLNAIMKYFPSSAGIQLKPDMLVKNVRGIYVNTDVAKEIGMSDSEIYELQKRVEKWHNDEDIRDLRRKIAKLEDEIKQVMTTRKRGRPSLEFTRKQDLLRNYKEQIPILRMGKRGKDPTIDANGNVKSWQIKALDDKNRRAIEGLFDINPQYLEMQHKLSGKSIVVFDDNISSGATLDDFCLKLKQLGVANIIAFTLGVIEPTVYKMSDRIHQNS